MTLFHHSDREGTFPISHFLKTEKPRTWGSAAVENRQPHGRLARAGPFDPVLLVGGDIDPIPRHHLHDPVLELEAGGTLQDHHPFVLRLVIPRAFGRLVPRADDPFDPDAMALLKDGGEFLGEVLGKVGEEVHGMGGIHAYTGSDTTAIRRSI